MNRYNELERALLEDDFDERGILRDGHTYRVKLSDEDDMQREIAQYAAQKMADAAARRFGLSNAFAMNKPGFRHLMDSKAIAAKERAYELRDRADTEAWRDADGSHTSSITGAGEKGHAGWRVGDTCTCASVRDRGRKGDRGRVELDEDTGELICVSNDHRSDDGADMRDAAYAAYDNEIANAWRK